MKKVRGYNGVTSFAAGYGSVGLICQLPDGKMETILLQEVVHLPGSFNLITQSQIMDKDVKVEPTASTSTIAMASGLPLHLRSRGYSFAIELRDRPNTPISMAAACWNLRRLGMHLGTMQRSGCYGAAAWHTSI
jgi:hypothetical protein